MHEEGYGGVACLVSNVYFVRIYLGGRIDLCGQQRRRHVTAGHNGFCKQLERRQEEGGPGVSLMSVCMTRIEMGSGILCQWDFGVCSCGMSDSGCTGVCNL